MYRLQKAGLVAVAVYAIAFCVLYAVASMAQPACDWNLVATPNPGPGHKGLSGVAALSSQDIYALGSNGAGPFIIRWDGTGWTDLPLPDLGGDIGACGP